MKITDLLDDKIKEILSEESLTAIQDAFDGKVQLATEAALVEQDELYASKLKNFRSVLDADYAKKLKRVYEAVDKDRAGKLVKVVNKFNELLNEKAESHQMEIVNSLDAYLDTFLAESFSDEDLKAAVNNKTAYALLEKLRGVLAVDSSLMQESVRSAVIDGKEQMDALKAENVELKKTLVTLKESYDDAQKTSLIEESIEGMDDKKKNFIRGLVKDKNPQFIKENFDYISKLYDNKQLENRKKITEEAKKSRKVKPDVVIEEKVNKEEVNNSQVRTESTDMYMDALGKQW